jgi:hypothetical protein
MPRAPALDDVVASHVRIPPPGDRQERHLGLNSAETRLSGAVRPVQATVRRPVPTAVASGDFRNLVLRFVVGGTSPALLASQRSTRTMFDRTVHLPRRVTFLVLLGLTLVLAACSSAASILSTVGSSVGDGNGAAQPAASAAPAAGRSPGTGGSDSGVSQDGKPLYDVNPSSLLIIKTGTLSLQVDGIDAALSTASQKIVSLGGYESGSNRQGDGDNASASVTYRIPAPKWEDALAALRGLATKVLTEQTQSSDVTGQVVDISARITNLQATEQALQAIMQKAEKISDVLAVQQQLTDVRGQIEELTGQRSHLQGQAAYSTLTVNFSLKPEQAVVQTTKGFDPGSEVDRASASLVNVLQAVATAGIWFGIVWLPILLAIGVVTAVVIFILQRATRPGPGGPGTDTLPTPTAEA